MIAVTFYSFKGGVGRTMALANVAWAMAKQGTKILVADFDMDSPGLSWIQEFLPENQKEKLKAGGIFQMMKKFCTDGVVDDINKYLIYPQGEDKPFYFLPSGDVDTGYDLESLDMKKLNEVDPDSKQNFFHKFKLEAEKLGVDYLLMDSQNGISDFSPVLMRQLSDAVVILFSLNTQNIAGTRWALDYVKREIFENKRVLLVASPVPEGLEELKAERLKDAERSFMGLEIAMTLPYNPRVSLMEEPFILNFADSHLGESYNRLLWKILEFNPADLLILMKGAREALNKQKFSLAEEKLFMAIKHHPTQIEPYMALTPILLQKGKREEALRINREYIRIFPHDARILMLLALLSDPRDKHTEPYFKKAIELEPKNVDYLHNYALFLERSKNYEESRVYYQKVLDLEPLNVEILEDYANMLDETGDYREAEENYKTALKLAPDKLSLLGNYANFLMKEELYDLAEEYYKKILELDPHNITTLGNYSALLSGLERFEEAEKYFKRVIALEPEDPQILGNYASMLSETERLEEADKYFKKSLAIDAQDVDVINNYAVLLRKTDREAEAEEYYKKALELEPHNITTLGNYATLLSKLKREREADKLYRRALKISPGNADIMGNYAALLSIMKREAEAEEYYKKALELEPENLSVLKNYVSLLLVAKKEDTAEELYKRILKLDPQDSFVLSNYGRYLTQTGKFKDAIPLLQEAIKTGGEKDWILLHLAYSLLFYGMRDNAVEIFQKLLTMIPPERIEEFMIKPLLKLEERVGRHPHTDTILAWLRSGSAG